MTIQNKVRLHLPAGERHIELHDNQGNVLLEYWDHQTRRDIESGAINLETSALTQTVHDLYREHHV
jgi:hypothetical protein